MDVLNVENSNFLETLISIFSVEKGDLKILLVKKQEDPYKGYWVLPRGILTNTETLEENIEKTLYNETGLKDVKVEQCKMFSKIDRNPNARVIGASFIGLIDAKSIELKKELREDIEMGWFLIDELPKIGYDHEEITINSINTLKQKLLSSDVLKTLFPSDFTLPELQKIYEQILGKKLDRRNFRKKFLSLDLIEDTNEKNIGCNGRPAKLYKFKDDIKNINIF